MRPPADAALWLIPLLQRLQRLRRPLPPHGSMLMRPPLGNDSEAQTKQVASIAQFAYRWRPDALGAGLEL
jgi:hypothetical protein